MSGTSEGLIVGEQSLEERSLLREAATGDVWKVTRVGETDVRLTRQEYSAQWGEYQCAIPLINEWFGRGELGRFRILGERAERPKLRRIGDTE